MEKPKSLKHGRLTIGVEKGEYYIRLQYHHGLDEGVYRARSRGELFQRLASHLATEHSLDREYDVGFAQSSDLSNSDERAVRLFVGKHNLFAGVYCLSRVWKEDEARRAEKATA